MRKVRKLNRAVCMLVSKVWGPNAWKASADARKPTDVMAERADQRRQKELSVSASDINRKKADIKQFTYLKQSKELIADASDLGMAVGYVPKTIRIQGKDKVLDFGLKGRTINSDNEVESWEYRSLAMPGIKVVVFND